MNHEEHVWKPGAEVGSVRVVVPRRFRSVYVNAFWAVGLNHSFAGNVGQSQGQHWLAFAVHSGTVSEVPALIFLNHLGDSAIGENVTSVDEAVEHLGGLLNQVGLVEVDVDFVFVGLEVENHVQRLSVVRHLLVESRQIELVLDVVLVNLAEELIASQPAEP